MEWISVNKQWPENDQIVLVYGKRKWGIQKQEWSYYVCKYEESECLVYHGDPNWDKEKNGCIKRKFNLPLNYVRNPCKNLSTPIYDVTHWIPFSQLSIGL